MSNCDIYEITKQELEELNKGKTLFIEDGRSGFEIKLEKQKINKVSTKVGDYIKLI